MVDDGCGWCWWGFWVILLVTPISTMKGKSLTLGVRGGECPVILPVHWKGVALPRHRSSRTLKTL